MHKINRRKFLGNSALASGALLVPGFLRAHANNIPVGRFGGKVLVVIQLAGGNDGLNTVVPYNDDLYYRGRPTLAVKKNTVLKVHDELGFNPVMQAFREVYDNGDVAILNNVGYPNPNRSHFRSMDIWQSASDSDKYIQSGWVGRTLDSECNNSDCPRAFSAIDMSDNLNLALKGEKFKGLTIEKAIAKLYANTDEHLRSLAAENSSGNFNYDDNLGYLYKTMIDAVESTDQVYARSKVYKSAQIYPKSYFGDDLRTVAELIVSEINTSIYYITLDGFDTHKSQVDRQNNLLKLYSEGMKAFVKDLKKNGKFNDVLIMTFSEIGRRLKQNDNGGTDHGKANNLFLMSGKLSKSGILNEQPDLQKLDQGDLIHQIDFRQVYATIIDKWFGADHRSVLGKNFNTINFI